MRLGILNLSKKSGEKLVDQVGIRTNESYLVDFIEFTLSAKLINSEEIKGLFINTGFSAAQIARKFGVSKSVILSRLRDLGIQVQTGKGRMNNPENFLSPHAPYGFSKKNAKLIPNRSELRICRLVVELMGRQKKSARAIAIELEKKKYKNRDGKCSWSHGSVQRIFKRWKNKF